MADIQRLAKLIQDLTAITPEAQSEAQAICDEIIAIAGHWYVIGKPEGKYYLDALNLDGNGDLLKRVIKAYIALRQAYMRTIRIDPGNYQMGIADRAMMLGQLIPNCGEVAALALPEIKDMLESDDTEIEWLACLALKEVGLPANPLIIDLFNLMEKRGLDCFPYRVGESLVRLSKSSPQILDRLKANLSSSNEKILHATLYTCHLIDEKSDFFYEELKRIIESKDGETKSLAILAIASTGHKDDELCDILIENATDPEWYIRGNAIRSLGKLQLCYEKALPFIIDALNDEEGHDWTVQECAIESLSAYADCTNINAETVVPILRDLRKRIKDEGDTNWIGKMKDINYLLHKTIKK